MQNKIRTIEDFCPGVSQIPLLTYEEQLYHLSRIKNGDAVATEIFKEHNLRFVAAVAKRYVGRGMTKEQLMAAGVRGLMAAAERFEEGQGYKFIPYAVCWIRQYILKELSPHG